MYKQSFHRDSAPFLGAHYVNRLNLQKMQIPFLFTWGNSFVRIGLATIGVCVFYAAASVAAFLKYEA